MISLDSKLRPHSFDLVHARYQIALLGRGPEQVASYRWLVSVGWLTGSGGVGPGLVALQPPCPRGGVATIRLLSEIFASLGGEARPRTS